MPDDMIINGFTVTPTDFRYLPRRPIGLQGDGRPIYPGIRSAQLRWDIKSYAEWSNLQVSFEQFQSQGTAVVNIPAFPTGSNQSYGFTEYSGVYLSEPLTDVNFAEHPTNLVLVISNIPAD